MVNSSGQLAEQLWFCGVQQLELRRCTLPPLAADQLLVATEISAISAGTELLLYRGQVPETMALDTSLSNFQQQSHFPLQYGYASLGQVIALGPQADPSWLGQRVFAFQPHASHFVARAEQLISVPHEIDARDALFFANMETAISLVQDARPVLGERVVVLGLGVVGLLLSGLLASYPLNTLIALDGFAKRREQAGRQGLGQILDPQNPAEIAALKQQLQDAWPPGADLIFEVTGAPQALNLALELCGYASRIIIGSWYGNRTAPLGLGGEAHRNHLSPTTSQVSRIPPELTGRWDKQRRYALTWEAIARLRPSQLITHSLPLAQAHQLYQTLDQQPQDIIQAILSY